MKQKPQKNGRHTKNPGWSCLTSVGIWTISHPLLNVINSLNPCHRLQKSSIWTSSNHCILYAYLSHVNHFSTTGRCCGPAHYDVAIRQAARAAFATSSFKIFLTQTFPRCGATCYILPSRAMTLLFNGVNFVYRSVEVYLTFCSYLLVLVRIRKLLQWRTVLTTLAICHVMF